MTDAAAALAAAMLSAGWERITAHLEVGGPPDSILPLAVVFTTPRRSILQKVLELYRKCSGAARLECGNRF